MIVPLLCLLLLAQPLLAQEAILETPGPPDSVKVTPKMRPTRPVNRPPARIKNPEEAEYRRIMRDARNLMRRGKYEETLARLDMLSPERRFQEEPVRLRGTSLRKLGRFEEACSLYRREADKLAASGHKKTPMLIELERALREKKDREGAFAVCLELHREGGGTTAWVLDEMESLIQADRLGAAALPPLSSEIEKRPDAADLRRLYIGALFFLKRYEESLQEAILLDRSSEAKGRVLLEQLRLADKRRIGESALAIAEAAVSEGVEGPELQETLLLKARALGRLRRYVEADETYRQTALVNERGPFANVALSDRAELLVKGIGDLEAGEKAYEELIASLETAPRREKSRFLSKALVALADCRLRMGSYEGANEVLKRVEEHETDASEKEEAVFQQAEISFYAGSAEAAKAGYDRVVKEFKGGNRVNDSLERLLLLTRASNAGAVPLAALGQIAYQKRIGSPLRCLEISREAAKVCGDCAAAEDLLREESLALLDLKLIDEAAERADSLASRFADGSSAPIVLRAVADSMRDRDGETEAVIHRYEDLVVRFPKSHEAFEVRSLLRELKKDSSEVDIQPSGEAG